MSQNENKKQITPKEAAQWFYLFTAVANFVKSLFAKKSIKNEIKTEKNESNGSGKEDVKNSKI